MAEINLNTVFKDAFGYEAFGQPYCEPGYKAILIDDKYKERGGNYLVTSTEVVYGMNGFRRTVKIGNQL